MYGITDLKTGVTIELDGVPFIITKYQHSAMGRGGAVMKTTLKNLLTGAMMERTFHGTDKVQPADLGKAEAQFLYLDDTGAHFMDPKSFEQFAIVEEALGKSAKFLKPEMLVEVLSFNNRSIGVTLPTKVEYEVVYTEPAVRGNTASGMVMKPARLETEIEIQVPAFVNIGDRILVDTRDGSYIERAS